MRASSRLSIVDALPSRSICLPTPEPTPELDESHELPRIPRGADPKDYDLSVEEDYEVWARLRPITIKGWRTAMEECAEQRSRNAKAAWADDDDLSDLSSSDLSEIEDSPVKNRRQRKEQQRKPRRPQQLPTPEPSDDGDYDAPPLKKLCVDHKDFLTCGLYSGSSEKPASALPLPLNYGETRLEEERDFRLSYDIALDYGATGEGRMRHIERLGRALKPPHYTRISKNIFPERHKLTAFPIAICQCKPGDPCGEDCINRLMLYLCSPKTCPAGESCTNGPLSMREPLRLTHFWTGSRGFGLKTLVDIPAGQFIMEYCGEVISREESYRRILEEYSGKHDYYLLDYDGGEVLDAGMKGNVTRFSNHSCDPNVLVTRWKLADYDEFQIGLFAARDIPAGSELTYDYGFLAFASLAPVSPVKRKKGEPRDLEQEAAEEAEREKTRQRCYCGAANCIGWLGAKRKTKDEQTAQARAAAKVSAKPLAKRLRSS